MLSARDLQSWRDNLIEKMEPSSVNRTCNGLRRGHHFPSLSLGFRRRWVYEQGDCIGQ